MCKNQIEENDEATLERLVFVDESSTNIANIALTPRYARAPRGERAYAKASRNWGKNVTLISSITLAHASGGDGSVPEHRRVLRSSETESLGLYMKHILSPTR